MLTMTHNAAFIAPIASGQSALEAQQEALE